VAERYRAAGDGVALLIGEHVDDPEHRPIPADVRQLIDRFGLPLVVTVTGRDRTADDAARIFDELAPLGVAAVHCVTGDHPAARFGPGRRATFGADSVALTELAADRGLPVTVAESPASPPAAARPGRVLTKQRAGAGAVVLNHAGGAEALRRFARRCVAVGATTPLIAPVPLITDADSARRLARFPGLHLDPDLVDAALAASEPEVEGRRRAVDLARALLRPPDGQPSFAGVNLSGTGPTDPVERAELVAGILDDVAGGDLA
jgi:5,10-methylenetetrahydrofolate reductase